MSGKKNPNGGRKGRPFQIIETGEIFNTLKECEEAIDGNNRHINDCLKGRQKLIEVIPLDIYKLKLKFPRRYF